MGRGGYQDVLPSAHFRCSRALPRTPRDSRTGLPIRVLFGPVIHRYCTIMKSWDGGCRNSWQSHFIRFVWFYRSGLMDCADRHFTSRCCGICAEKMREIVYEKLQVDTSDIRLHRLTFRNSRGAQIAARIWTCKSRAPAAVAGACHGYSTYLEDPCGVQQIYYFVSTGIACIAIDYEGCGFSEGCRMHVER